MLDLIVPKSDEYSIAASLAVAKQITKSSFIALSLKYYCFYDNNKLTEICNMTS